MVAVSPSTIATLDHHFGDHHLGSDSSSSSSGCSHSSSSSSVGSDSSSTGSGGSVTLPKKHVFLTHDAFAANLGGTNGADAKCVSAASAAGLSGTYVALVSSGTTSGLARVTSSGPYYTVSEEYAYTIKDDFLSTSLATVLDELGGLPPTSEIAWSGSDAKGHASSNDCFSWTSVASSDVATVAHGESSDFNYTGGWGGGSENAACSETHPLFCVEN